MTARIVETFQGIAIVVVQILRLARLAAKQGLAEDGLYGHIILIRYGCCHVTDLKLNDYGRQRNLYLACSLYCDDIFTAGGGLKCKHYTRRLMPGSMTGYYTY
jgi:hypothetical protein